MQASLDRLRKLSGGRTAQVVACAAAGRRTSRRRGAHRRRAMAASASSIFPSCAARNMGAQRGDDDVDALPVAAERLFAKAGFDVVYPRGAGRAVLRPAVREQGPRDAADRKSAELEAALRDASDERAPAHRVRHEPVRLSDEALPRWTTRGPGQHRVHPRHGAAARRRSSASATSGRHPSGMQRAQDGHRRQARRASRSAAARTSCRSTKCCAAASPGTRASTVRS